MAAQTAGARHKVTLILMTGRDDAPLEDLKEGARLDLTVSPTMSCDLFQCRVAELLQTSVDAFSIVFRDRVLRGAWCLGTMGVIRPCEARVVPRGAEARLRLAAVGTASSSFITDEILRPAVDAALELADEREAEAESTLLSTLVAETATLGISRGRKASAKAPAWMSHPWAAELMLER